jgi:hypothetical protein
MRRYLAVWALVLLGVASANASIIAYSDPANGDQSWTGNLGLTFDVVSPITVVDLGVFDSTGTGIISGPIQVVIYDTTTNTEVTPVVSFSGDYSSSQIGNDVFQSITPVDLAVGSYEVDAVGFNGFNLNGNLMFTGFGPVLNTGGGLLMFTGAAYDYATSLDEPWTCTGCVPAPSPQNQLFEAGTFEYQPAASDVPEPGSFGLAAAGFIGLAAILRYRVAR